MPIKSIPSHIVERFFRTWPKHKTSFCSCTVKVFPSPMNDFPSMTIITGKKNLSKLAVYRNRARRRITAAAQLVFPQHALNGVSYLIYANPEVVTAPFPDLVSQMENALKYVREKDAQPSKKQTQSRKVSPSSKSKSKSRSNSKSKSNVSK
ncbi:hypothetical protein BCR43DRAFT_492120 [Syncephalastrum racemosum]|uniref:Uncharacterized protein n=1 Tax=Syncephalastrum racemosum TaxID=13706 RepID=A0A1X2HEF9_SYNRA|nr:hypothetical protein BCR43DRAFT_492120 [Syncephalastrum racemosum]